MKKIFSIKGAAILLTIVAILGAFGLLKDENTSSNTTKNEKFYCTIKKEDILHDVKPANTNYSMYSDSSLFDNVLRETRHYHQFVRKVSESSSKLASLKVQISAERGPISNQKPITKEQQAALDKAKEEVEMNYQVLKSLYKTYKPTALALLNEVQKRQEIERKKGIKPEKSKFPLGGKYSDYHLDDTDCIPRKDENH